MIAIYYYLIYYLIYYFYYLFLSHVTNNKLLRNIRVDWICSLVIFGCIDNDDN